MRGMSVIVFPGGNFSLAGMKSLALPLVAALGFPVAQAADLYVRRFETKQLTGEFNKDGWDYILILGFPGEDSSWFENPKGKEGAWARHLALDVTDNESPTFGDLTGDGKPEIICSSKGAYGYASPDANHPDQP